MTNIDNLLKDKENILTAIESAANTGDSGLIISETKRLSEIEALINRQEALDRDVEVFRSSIQPKKEGFKLNLDPTLFYVGKESPRQQGTKRRGQFVEKCAAKGVLLEPVRGALYKNVNGEIVGIAYASERKENGWFLGLPEGEFQHAALLCEDRHGSIFNICLPAIFFEMYGKKLSKSKGQTKFNVTRREGLCFLTIPEVGQVSVDGYVGREQGVAPAAGVAADSS